MRRRPRFRMLWPLAVSAIAVSPGCTCSRSSPPGVVRDRSNGALPTLRAPNIGRATIVIDGELSEPEWQRAGTTDALVSPSDGRPVPSSRVQAVGRMMWNDEFLYLSAVVNDRDPTSPFSERDVDPHLWERSSAVEWMIQPGDPGDNREYYEIQIDTHRAIWDTRFDDYNRPIEGSGPARTFGHQDWDSRARRAARVDHGAGRYTLEVAIPWAAFASSRSAVPPRGGDVWRMNVYSFRDGQADSLAWSPTLGQGNFHFAPRFGRVVFNPP